MLTRILCSLLAVLLISTVPASAFSQAVKRAPLSAAACVNDAYWSSVVLLAINDNQADTTTAFDDQSNGNLTLTAAGNTQYDTAQAPTGMTSSALFDGNDWINLPSSATLSLDGDFTIEAMIRLNANDTDSMLLGPDAGVRNNQTRINQSATGMYSMYDGSSNPTSTANGGGWNNTWRHSAWSRTGTSLTFWEAGSKVGDTLTSSGTFNFSELTIGAQVTNDTTYSSNGVNGWIASIRITKGVGRYTTTFTPPTLPMPTSGC